jgi:cyclophilin family peptidyl-prolyl cis-trans isomerase/protein-disulfide isomerase
MRKFWLAIILLAAMVLSACSSAAPTPATTAVQETAMECTLFNILPEPRDPASVKLPAINGQDWSRGSENAVLTLLVYSDFQCPYCSLAGRYLKEYENAHPDDVRVIYRHFPLNIHDKSVISARAVEAAGLQGKFWEMHDFLLAEENWQVWTSMTPADFETWIVEEADTLGLDAARYQQDLTSAEIAARIDQAYKSALDMGLNSTPSMFFFINGELTFVPADQVPYDPATLDIIMNLIKMKDKQYNQCPPVVIDQSKAYTATLKTEKGDIKIKLFANKAPLAVNSFVFLSREGYFDGVTFHRVLADFVAQTGDPSGTGSGGPGYTFANEISADLKYDHPGVVGMANSGADTNGSQFFITYKALPDLDGNYTIFGEVIEGMDVVQQLTLRNPATAQGETLPPGDRILTITIEEK